MGIPFLFCITIYSSRYYAFCLLPKGRRQNMYLTGCQGITENALEGLGETGFLGGDGVGR